MTRKIVFLSTLIGAAMLFGALLSQAFFKQTDFDRKYIKHISMCV